MINLSIYPRQVVKKKYEIFRWATPPSSENDDLVLLHRGRVIIDVILSIPHNVGRRERSDASTISLSVSYSIDKITYIITRTRCNNTEIGIAHRNIKKKDKFINFYHIAIIEGQIH